VSELLPVLDLGRGREVHEKLAKRLKDWARSPAERPMTALMKTKVTQIRRELGFDLLAIDSWTALVLFLEMGDLRRETFDMFEWLRSLGCTTFVVAEECEGEEGLEEEFLADAIFRVRLEAVTETSFQRRIQCSKMRSANHSSDFYTLVFESGHFEVAKAIS
jgi:KaiC/GvpD/RAD55 family RecA-like ATPase